jgi:signal transduction histidine kinase
MKILRSKTSRVILPVFTLCLFVLTLIWISYLRQRSFDKEDAIRFAIERNSNLSIALEQYAIRTLRNADALLQMIKMEYKDGDSLNLQQLIVKNSLSRDIIKGAVIIGSDGQSKIASVADTHNLVPGFSDRPYFNFHLKNNTDSLLITGPLVSKLTEKPVVTLSRRLNDKKGRFAGVIAVQVQPSTFTSFYAQARLLPNDIISLIAPNGITYARRTGSIESSGENISKSPLFVHVAHRRDSFYFAPDAIRQIPTWFSYRQLKDYPIIATVGSSESDILADFRARQPRYIIPRIIISVLVILFSFLGAKFILHRRKLSASILEEEEKYQRLLTEQMITVQEREREWIGRELHDNVGQVLTTVKLYLETAAQQGDHPLIPRSMKLINNSITEIRNLSHQLTAPTLGTRSLIDSITALTETVACATKLKFEFDHKEYTRRVAMSQKLALYRILQEQLSNIIKHAEATKVWIRLSQSEDNVLLTVRDNGKGFDTSIKTDGMGINNIISRAKVFDGTVTIKAVPGKGCVLEVTIPAIAVEAEPCYT